MAISYLTGINLNGNELQNVQVHVCAGLGDYPEHPVDGQIIYDSNAQLLKVYKVSGNSGSWSSVGEPLTAGKSIDITNNAIDVDVGGAAANSLLTVDSNGEIAPATVTVNGKTVVSGTAVTLYGSDIQLSNVDEMSVSDAVIAISTEATNHADNSNNPHHVDASQLEDGTLSANVKATTPAQNSNDTSIATTAYVTQKFGSVDALQYKGTVDGGSTGSYGALTVAANKGDVYKVSTAGKIDGVPVEVGDMLICNTDNTPAATTESGDTNYATVASKWDFIQRNIDGAVTGPASSTDFAIALFDGTSGKVIKDSGVGLLSFASMCRPAVTGGLIASDAVTPSVTVSFNGTYLSSYVIDENGELVMVKTELGNGEVTFACDQNPSSNLTCYVVALPG